VVPRNTSDWLHTATIRKTDSSQRFHTSRKAIAAIAVSATM
jgi:hypothetical protein